MKICISAESTIDLPKDLLNKYDIHTIPYTIIMGDKEYFDGEIMPEEIFKKVDATKILPKTSAINEEQYGEYFENLLKIMMRLFIFAYQVRFRHLTKMHAMRQKN